MIFQKGSFLWSWTDCTQATDTGRMLEDEDFEALDLLVPFVGAFVNNATNKERDYPMTCVHTLFSKLEWL